MEGRVAHQPLLVSELQSDCPFVWYQNICSAPFRFVTIHACDRQTDRITTPKTDLAYARAVKTILHYAIYQQPITNLDWLVGLSKVLRLCSGLVFLEAIYSVGLGRRPSSPAALTAPARQSRSRDTDDAIILFPFKRQSSRRRLDDVLGDHGSVYFLLACPC